jgi:outer membrane protein assembly factor BamB
MRDAHLWLPLAGALCVGLPWASAEDALRAEEGVVKGAGFKTDGSSLVEFFRARTPSKEDLRHLKALIGQLGSDSYREREEASQELARQSPVVIPFLERGLESSDLEVRRRVRLCLQQIERGPGPALPLAAARLLAERQPKGAVPVLLGYLPFAEDGTVAEEVFAALLALTPEGKPEPALAGAVRNPSPRVREAAAHVLARKGTPAQRKELRALLADPEPRVRLRTARGLLVAEDRAGVEALIALLEEGPVDLAWQAEEDLRRLAGAKAPTVALGEGKEERKNSRAVWEAWWKEHGSGIDLAKYRAGPVILGLTLCIEYNTNRIWECGRDGKARWEITGLQGPMDAQVLPGGQVLVVEANNRKLSERDQKGKVLWEVTVPGRPNGCRLLSNGKVFVSTSESAMEYVRGDKRPIYTVKFHHNANAVCKFRDHILYATNDEIVEMTTEGKRVRSISIPRGSMYSCIQGLPGGRYLVTNNSTHQVLEVDRTGKVLWKTKFTSACGLHRLPNGHTLVSTRGIAAELDRTGKKVWEASTPGYIRRVHRR